MLQAFIGLYDAHLYGVLVRYRVMSFYFLKSIFTDPISYSKKWMDSANCGELKEVYVQNDVLIMCSNPQNPKSNCCFVLLWSYKVPYHKIRERHFAMMPFSHSH